MPDERQDGLLLDILESARSIRSYLAGVSRESFMANEEKQDAVLRRFEIIGEAASRLSQETQALFPTLPFRSMRGMRKYHRARLRRCGSRTGLEDGDGRSSGARGNPGTAFRGRVKVVPSSSSFSLVTRWSAKLRFAGVARDVALLPARRAARRREMAGAAGCVLGEVGEGLRPFRKAPCLSITSEFLPRPATAGMARFRSGASRLCRRAGRMVAMAGAGAR